MQIVRAKIEKRTNDWRAAHTFRDVDAALLKTWICGHEHLTEQSAENCSWETLFGMIERRGGKCMLCGQPFPAIQLQVAIFDVDERIKGKAESVAHAACVGWQGL